MPANPNALAVAKSLKISPATMDLVFAGKGKNDGSAARAHRRASQQAPQVRKGTTMSFAQRITAAEQRLNALRDQLNEHWTKTDETNVSDEQLKIASELNERIAQEERTLAALRDAERHLGSTSEDANGPTPQPRAGPARTAQHRGGHRIGSSAAVQHAAEEALEPLDYLVRAGTVQLLAHRDRVPFDVEDAGNLRRRRSHPRGARMVARAASAPAMTTVTGWAAELAQTLFTDFMEVL